MSSEVIVSVDTETGGFNYKLNALLTLGVFVAETQTGKVLYRKEFRFNDYCELVDKTPEEGSDPIYVEKGALQVNKLDLEELAQNGIPLEVADEEITSFLTELNKNRDYRIIPLGQNLKFDLGFISVNMPKLYAFLMSCRYHRELSTASTMWHLFKKVDFNKSVSLDNIRKEMGIVSNGQTHSSLVDAEDTFNIYKNIINDLTNS